MDKLDNFLMGNVIIIKFNGKIDNLIEELDKITNVLGKRNYYSSDINLIKNEIIPFFDNYKNYTTIYFKKIILNNKSIKFYNPYYYEYLNVLEKSRNPPLHDWFFTEILLIILFVLFVITISITIYCYFFELNFYTYILALFY